MEFILNPHSEDQPSFAYWEGAFSEHELNWLQEKAKDVKMQAGVGGFESGTVDTSIRRSGLHWLPCFSETQWVFQKLGFVVSSLNSQFFRFDLLGFGEQIQLTNYNDSEKGTYGWHIDMATDIRQPCRKLSIVMQLSDPVDYEGGVLEIQPFGKEIIKLKKQRGLIVAFPSWVLHQVTPVTQGNRQSLVAWITGPAFK